MIGRLEAWSFEPALWSTLMTVRVSVVASLPIDFDKRAYALAASVVEVPSADPFSGTVPVIRAEHTDRIKILVCDGSGLVLVWK
jgi:transposase